MNDSSGPGRAAGASEALDSLEETVLRKLLFVIGLEVARRVLKRVLRI